MDESPSLMVKVSPLVYLRLFPCKVCLVSTSLVGGCKSVSGMLPACSHAAALFLDKYPRRGGWQHNAVTARRPRRNHRAAGMSLPQEACRRD